MIMQKTYLLSHFFPVKPRIYAIYTSLCVYAKYNFWKKALQAYLFYDKIIFTVCSQGFYCENNVGVWLSLVKRSSGGREIASSNLVTPILKKMRHVSKAHAAFFYIFLTNIMICFLYLKKHHISHTVVFYAVTISIPVTFPNFFRSSI